MSSSSTPQTPNTLSHPVSYQVNQNKQAVIGGIEVSKLAKEYGTPLYILDEQSIRLSAQAYKSSLESLYPGESLPLYACKANMSIGLVKLMNQEGMGLDVVSGGEIYTAVKAGFPMERVLFNGNNKTRQDIEMAVENNVNRISVDNFHDLKLIHEVAQKRGKVVPVLFRITPGIECHTHDYIKTGQINSKFGFDLSQLSIAIDQLHNEYKDTIVLKGLHAHIGSQIFEIKPFEDLINIMMTIYYNIRESYNGLVLDDIDLGGGIGVAYTGQDDPLQITDALAAISKRLELQAKKMKYPLPRLLMEPGRSMIATAGVTAYTVGSMKEVPNHRKFVAVDGGMGDNIRSALYQAEYSALIANRVGEAIEESVCIVGKYCESGDVLIQNLPVPRVESGDTLVIFGTGAYNYSMASNYNRFPRPATVLVNNGQAHLLTQRETYETVIQQDLVPSHLR